MTSPAKKDNKQPTQKLTNLERIRMCLEAWAMANSGTNEPIAPSVTVSVLRAIELDVGGRWPEDEG